MLQSWLGKVLAASANKIALYLGEEKLVLVSGPLSYARWHGSESCCCLYLLRRVATLLIDCDE